jgi:hypothetical protein
MSELASAFTFRLFGTRRLATESVAVLASLAVLPYLTPSSLVLAVQAVVFAVYYIALYGFIGLFAGVIPGLLIGIGKPGLLLTLLILFCRGYVSVFIRYLNWLCHNYCLAKEDVRLHNLFASDH